MSVKLHWLGVVGSLALAFSARAREYDSEIVVESPEELYDLLETGEIEEDTVDLLVALMERPMDINRADSRLLYDLPGITYKMAHDIVEYRRINGPFQAVDDLLQVEGVTPSVLESIGPFVAVTIADATGATATVKGDARVGTILRDGFAKNTGESVRAEEVMHGPQSYLRLKGSAYNYFGFGLLTTYRSRTQVQWEASGGRLLSDGPQRTPDLDQIYVTWAYGSWTAIAGSYDIGFGERLTFNSSAHRDPHGWYENERVSEDNETGRLKVNEGLFGGAVSLLGADLPFGWVDVTAFASSQLLDIYQYDIRFGTDEHHAEQGACQTDGDCPINYSCGDDNICYTSRIVDTDTGASYLYTTLKDAYRETIYGANATLNLDEDTSVGVTAYQGTADVRLAPETSPRFAPAMKYPTDETFGAAGLSFRTMVARVLLSGEYATTGGGGHGVFARSVLSTSPVEVTLGVRHYNPWFENPYGNPQSAADEEFGLRARNEQGVNLEVVTRAVPGVRLVTVLDLYRHTNALGYDTDGAIVSEPIDEAPMNMRARQTVSYDLTSKDDLSLTLKYNNNDLDANGREEFYEDESESTIDEQVSLENLGRGEKRQIQVGYTTRQLQRLSIAVSATQIWEDIKRLEDSFDSSQRYRLRLTARAWEGGHFVVGASTWQHEAREDALSDREDPRYTAFADLRQKVTDDLIVRARYGILNYFDLQDGRYPWYQIAKVSVEGRF
jgi:hypothetical protein